MLDSRPRGRGFKSHRRHCVVSLSKNINPSLCLGYICYGLVRFSCLRFSLRFFRHRRRQYATTFAFTLLTITLRFFRRQQGQNLTQTLRILYDNRRVIVQSRVTDTTTPYKSYDARTMTLRKSQGVGPLANQLASQADSLGALIFLGSAYLPSNGTWVARF